MPMSERGHADQEHSVKYIAAHELVQAFTGKHQQKRGDNQASATNGSKGNQDANYESQQRHLPALEILVSCGMRGDGRKPAPNVSLEENECGNQYQGSTQQADNQMIDVGHSCGLFQKRKQV